MDATTEFMYSVDSEEVNVALKTSVIKLTVKEFVTVIGFDIDEIMFNEFWQVAVNSRPPHVGGRLLQWLGYEGEPNKRKEKFIAYLKRNDIAYDELSFDDKRVEEYVSIQQEIAQMTGTNIGNIKRSKWLIMDSDDFKEAIMGLSTKRGTAIRRYYLRIEKLLKLYVEYERRFETRRLETEKTSLQNKMDKMMQKMDDQSRKMDELMLQNNKQTQRIDELKAQNNEQLDEIRILNNKNDEILDNLEVIQDKLEIAVEDRAPKTVAIHKRERFVLFKKNYPDDPFPYYVIRGQRGYCRNKLAAFNVEYPQMEILIDIVCQPNAVNLFNLFKEHNASLERQWRFGISGNNVALGINTEFILVKRLLTLHNERKHVNIDQN